MEKEGCLFKGGELDAVHLVSKQVDVDNFQPSLGAAVK